MAPLPAVSTLTAILRRHGRLDPAQRAGQPRALQRFEHPHPNALWQMDFKAGWPCGAGRCHPLTILDDHSRYALSLAACPNQRTATVRAQLVTTFQRYGLPDRVLVDNGSPWGHHPAHPYTPLTVWLRRLGIAVSHSRPYRPQTLGKDERFHGTPRARPRAAAAAAHASAPGRPLSTPGGTSTTTSARMRAWIWPCPPAAITSAPARTRPSSRRCPTGPRITSGASKRAAGSRSRATSCGCPRPLRRQPVAFRPTAIDGRWTIHFLTDDLDVVDLRNPA